ncbi:hypothetical protein [Spongiactinospora sp. TRM90649]|uniref:hypothetical protein n=1 Tax=Spongiactinospora sp. TRM90649 TaxID=3031114 RepID=UPI0023F89BDE|nr:hypothetical protein [Spongiactinospora sp. TRM90649]MDF5757638.1 hypothetical protein [Spongiactinospora sp. TRM90649]
MARRHAPPGSGDLLHLAWALDVQSVGALEAAEELHAALGERGIAGDIHGGHGLALVSVWQELIVWSDGRYFWWRTGWDRHRYRAIHAWHSALDPRGAAGRIAATYERLRAVYPAPPSLREEVHPL